MGYHFKFYQRLIKEVYKVNWFDLNIKEIIKRLENNLFKKKHQTWANFSNGSFLTDEDLSNNFEKDNIDLNLSKDYDWQMIKLFENQSDFFLDDDLERIFGKFNFKIKKIPGIEYIHLHSTHNFNILPHTDGNLVLLINLICPKYKDKDNFGLMINNVIYQPEADELIWLETNLIHSAWNFSKNEWRFLTISIDRDYISFTG